VNGIVPNQYEWPITLSRLQGWTIIALGLLATKWKDFVPHPNEGFLLLRTKFLFKPMAAPLIKKDD